ncbi:MAG: cell division protein FtsA [Minisyncoccia bacterium]|jgi:cell division protein FtsA
MSNIITGLDIGTSQVKGVVAEVKKDGILSVISVFKQPMSGFRRGVLVDVEEATQSLHVLVADLKKISKKSVQNVFISVQSEQVKARASRGVAAVARGDREIQTEDVDRVIQASRAVKMMPNSMVLHNIVREFFVDDVGDISDPLGMNGSRLEVVTLIVEGFAPQVNLVLKTLERLNVGVAGVIFNPLAAARSVISKKQKELGVLLIDFGAGTTSMAVYEESKVLHVRSLPVGSSYVTNDIAIGLKTSIEMAEKLKTSYGCALAKDINRREMINLKEVDGKSEGEISRHFLAEIIEIRIAEILGLIKDELKVLGKDFQLPAGVVATGGGVKLAGMTDLIKQELKLPVQTGFPNLSGFDVLNPAHREMMDDPEFAVATGLVISGQLEGSEPVSGGQAVKNFFRNLLP